MTEPRTTAAGRVPKAEPVLTLARSVAVTRERTDDGKPVSIATECVSAAVPFLRLASRTSTVQLAIR